MSYDMMTINRETYDFLKWMGDIGGMITIFNVALAFFATRFGALRMKALLTNRLYHLTMS
jgi:hypothetical protein